MQTQMQTQKQAPALGEKKPVPTWIKLLLAASAGGAATQGAEKLATDSPVHFAVIGEAPSEAIDWKCEPEGGIVGAQMVCRPVHVVDRSKAGTD